MTYGVQSVGIKDGFSGAAKFYQAGNAGVCPGSDDFSAYLVLQVLAPNATPHYITGTGDAASGNGWYVRRLADSASAEAEFEISVQGAAPIRITASFSLPTILGRTLLLAFGYDGATLQVYANGGLYDELGGVGPYVPSAVRFGLGNVGVPPAVGAVDRLVAFGYIGQATSASVNAVIWNAFRETCSMEYAGLQAGASGFEYVYDASAIAAPPTATRPTTWPNGGSVLGADLTWTSLAADVLTFTVDSDPDYTMVSSLIAP